MKRIIIWGCGKYGQYLYSLLNKYYVDRFCIKGVGDSNFKELNKQLSNGEMVFDNSLMDNAISTVYGYTDIKKMNDNKEIDGVIIAILDKKGYRTVEEILSVICISYAFGNCDKFCGYGIDDIPAAQIYVLRYGTLLLGTDL